MLPSTLRPVLQSRPARASTAFCLAVAAWIVDMSVEDQKRMVKDYDVILERCYAQNMGGGKYKSNLPSNLELIKEVGYEHVMVDTDGGQVENPHWELALEEYMQYLADHGIPMEQIDHMTKTIPARLLGLEEGRK